MKELIDKLPRMGLRQAEGMPMFDTCFVIDLLSRHKKIKSPFVLTTFTAEELVHVAHRLHDFLKKDIRNFLRDSHLHLVPVDVHPGDWKGEREYVASVDSGLLSHVHDASDAVLIAAAIQTKSNVYTRDKHHLYTADLESYLKKYNIAVYNKL